jgi:hypothetical protein
LLQSDYPAGVAAPGAPDAGNGTNENVVLYIVSAYWDPTAVDHFWAEWGFIQRFLKNSGEDLCPSSGPDDAIVAYRRAVPLPGRVTMFVQPRVDIGLSCESLNYQTLYAAPRLGVSVERDFGPVNVSLETHGYWYIEKYTSYTGPGGSSQVGGAPTPSTSLHAVGRVFANLPFYRPISVGVLGSMSATWYHQVQGSNPSEAFYKSEWDPQTPGQPFQNAFGGEAFVRYSFPTVRGVASDLEVSYALGDSTVTGYQGLLHDNGRASFNIFYQSVSEVYSALTFRY